MFYYIFKYPLRVRGLGVQDEVGGRVVDLSSLDMVISLNDSNSCTLTSLP
jgi:hypothetical protein